MITPRFSLTQDEKTVTILIRAPYCSLKELEADVEENSFLFICKPYYLRLHLPGKIEDNDSRKVSFNSDTGEFTFQYEKITVGEHFPDLEFVTKLLCTKLDVEEDGGRKIEIVNGDAIEAEEEDENDVQIQYGFAMRGGYNFKMLSSEFTEVFEIDPIEVDLEKRKQLRWENEQESFVKDHYLADFFDNEQIRELIKLETPWKDLAKANVEYTPKELDFLKDLSNVSYKLSGKQIKYCHNCLIDILYAYCYDCRTNCFEQTCESAWTISKISASLSWFDGFLSVKEAVICAIRRSLIYPLYREFNLCQAILKDLKSLMCLGEQYITKCLIHINDIFLTSDKGHYVLNNLFIKDYIVYMMKWDKELWKQTVEELMSIEITKEDLGLNLLQIELSASEEIVLGMNVLDIDDTDSDDDTASVSSDGTDDATSSSSDESNCKSL